MTPKTQKPYSHAFWYDLTYEWKNYAHDSQILQDIIAQYQQSKGNSILEVACGTGNYISHFLPKYQMTGVDLSEDMLAVARQKFPNVEFYQNDMRNFSLPQEFDVVMCLFSSIAYLGEADLLPTIANFAKHTRQGGLVIVEPFVDPDKVNPKHLHFLKVEKPDVLISRHSVAQREDNKLILNFHFLVTTEQSTSYFQEKHITTLFEPQVMQQTFEQCGLQTYRFENGLMPDRSLFVGVKL
ncbi:MAG: class I SAM-dependent methyltransferase [Chitinophagales bacterium]|jgi:ubiquinone/menaquinone biosynthesis C-methylase UbiE|nr:class I SAM-dependent methyltransferase [Chitinophagales bacterium]HNI44424.1 class I SAM-dependent methyltransferase [Chitinophagales bacterium]HNL07507.1 class I SAM-dependent methyltransferase [Chitinophagales bacterium]